MPKINIDEQKNIFEPIEITLEGKSYTIEKVTDEFMSKAIEMTKGEEKEDTTVLRRQLAFLLGQEAGAFEGVDIRKIGCAVRFITKAISDQITGEG